MAAITIPFQKISCWEEAEGLKTSIKEVKLHIPEAKRKMANTLSARLLVCCKTSANRIANVRELISGIKAHIFTSVFSPDS
jgi:hypothetical protein